MRPSTDGLSFDALLRRSWIDPTLRGADPARATPEARVSQIIRSLKGRPRHSRHRGVRLLCCSALSAAFRMLPRVEAGRAYGCVAAGAAALDGRQPCRSLTSHSSIARAAMALSRLLE